MLSLALSRVVLRHEHYGSLRSENHSTAESTNRDTVTEYAQHPHPVCLSERDLMRQGWQASASMGGMRQVKEDMGPVPSERIGCSLQVV